LIGSVAYNRAHLASALTLLLARRMEQDSVRSVMFAALLKMPPSVWRAEHLPDLAEISRAGLNDIGLSQHTLKTLQSLICGWHDTPRGECGRSPQVARMGADPTDLPSAAARHIGALLPVLDGWLGAERGGGAEHSKPSPPAGWLLRSHAEYCCATRAPAQRRRPGLVSRSATGDPALLGEDQSWISLPCLELPRAADLLSLPR
jgi:hypothetical protein